MPSLEPDLRPLEQLAAVQDRLAGWISDLTTLHDLTERLVRTGTLDDALNETLRAGATLVGARRGLITLAPADGLGPQTTVGLGLGPADLGHIETVPRSSASYARLLDGLPPADGERPEIVLADIPSEDGLDPRHREVAARLGFAASYAVPLTTAGADEGAETEPVVEMDPTDPMGAVSAVSTVDPDRVSPVDTGDPGDAERAARSAAADPATPVDRAPPRVTGRIGAAVWLYDEPAEPVRRQRHLLDLYLRHAAEHLARQLELNRVRQAERTVREELLPSRLPRLPGTTLAVRHRTGPHGGGDWYDVLPLPEGAVGLAVGAVSGSGPSAVAAMGRLRASMRAYAVMEGEDPVAVLSDLELLLRLTEPARSATALFGYAEPAGADGTWAAPGEARATKVVLAGAGHCPPLVVGPHRVEFVETTLSAPLGMLACWEAPSVELLLEPGETLLLYSDGLLHRTGEPMDQAFTRLQAAAAVTPPAAREDPEQLADYVLRTLLPDGQLDDPDSPDDVVLLAAQFRPVGTSVRGG